MYSTEVLQSNYCDYNDAYILVKVDISIIERNLATVAFKNCPPFIKCITKIDGTTIDDAEDLDLVMPIYYLLEYSSNNSDPTDNLWFYSKDEALNSKVNIMDNNAFKSSTIRLNYWETLKTLGKHWETRRQWSIKKRNNCCA